MRWRVHKPGKPAGNPPASGYMAPTMAFPEPQSPIPRSISPLLAIDSQRRCRAQVYRHQMILAGDEKAMRDKHGNPERIGRTAEEVKTAVLKTLAKAADRGCPR